MFRNLQVRNWKKLPDGSAHLYYITFSVGYTGCFQIFYGDPVSGGATGS